MNVVALVGNLASDVDLREVGAASKKVATFLLAVDRPGKTKDTEGQDADFVRVAAWERLAEVCATYLASGRRVAVDGRLRSHSWEEEGRKRSAVEVVANRIE